MKSYYLNDWAESKLEGLKKDFEINDTDLEGVNIVLASYGNEGYDGSAEVLFEKDDKLYMVGGGHCSCYGLEGQWEPQETTWETIAHLYQEGTFGTDRYSGNSFRNELGEILEQKGLIA